MGPLASEREKLFCAWERQNDTVKNMPLVEEIPEIVKVTTSFVPALQNVKLMSADGTFSPEQRAIYDIVLQAQDRAIDKAKT